MEKKLKTESIQDPLDTGEWMETSSETSASGDHILVSGEPYTLPLQISRFVLIALLKLNYFNNKKFKGKVLQRFKLWYCMTICGSLH